MPIPTGKIGESIRIGENINLELGIGVICTGARPYNLQTWNARPGSVHALAIRQHHYIDGRIRGSELTDKELFPPLPN